MYKWSKKVEEHSAHDLYSAYNGMLALRERTYRLMDGYDYILLPAVPVPAYAAELPAADWEDIFAPWAHTFLFNMTEQPGSSINCGYTEAGLPIGLQIVGKRFDDLGVLQMSRLYEQTRPASAVRDWPQL